MPDLIGLLSRFLGLRKTGASSEVQVVSSRRSSMQVGGMLSRSWAWLIERHAKCASKRMRLEETVSLGEKRIVALIQVDGQRFLIGGGSSGVSLLTALDCPPDLNARLPRGFITRGRVLTDSIAPIPPRDFNSVLRQRLDNK